MTLTLLLDLDDTLLESNMENFIPAYFQALSGSLQEFVSPEIMVQALLGGTKKMMENLDPERFLSEVFDEYFYPKIGLEREVLHPKINKFYDDKFPDLKYLIKQRQAAIDFVNWAASQDIRIVIATNPIFPLKAVHHRLRWAGLAPEDYSYTMITSYENFHFTKENLAYFPEILGKLGWPEGPVVMVGNDLNMDIKPAMAAGFPAFWVNSDRDGSSDQEEIPQGRIDEVRTWLETIDLESLQHSIKLPSALVTTLRSIPAVLQDLLFDLDEATTNYRMSSDEWSIKEVLCHLRDVEIEVNLPRIKKILSQENSFVAAMVTDSWVIERNYAGQSVDDAWKIYVQARKETIKLIEHLQLEWEKSVRHSIFGLSTLKEMVEVMVGHDKAHIQQIHHVKNNLHH